MCEVQTFLNQPTSVFCYEIGYQPTYENFSFAPSFYTEWDKGQSYKKFNPSIRNSVEVELNDQILSDKANQTLASMMAAIDEELVITDDKWRVLKYQSGHFVEHCDFYRQKDPLVHFGTQVWLPPKSMCSYEGGVLKTKDKEAKEILPSENEWTLVVLPLGVLHEVSQVEGVRISYVKPIYIRAKRVSYLVPRTSNSTST